MGGHFNRPFGYGVVNGIGLENGVFAPSGGAGGGALFDAMVLGE